MSRGRTRSQKTNKIMRKATGRIAVLAFFFALSSLALFGRVLYIKVVNGDEFEQKAILRTAGTEYEIDPVRGNIVDRNGKNLGISTIVYNVILDPSVMLASTEEEQENAIEVLFNELKIDKNEIKKILEDSPESKYKILKKEVSKEVQERLVEHKLKGVWLQETFIRKYPKETLASQTLGFFNKSGKGQYGIEQQYNDLMTGLSGRVFSKLQEGNIVTSEIVSAQDGHTLVLTLDEVIQKYTEDTLEQYSKEVGAKNAACIVMNPNTGEILSIAGYPTYNPNKYNDISDIVGKEDWKLLDDESKSKMLNDIWKNYNIHNTYEPGSTFKQILVAAALEEGVISENEQFYCKGFKEVAGEPIRCAKRSGHGYLNLEESLANSCNVAMMDIAEKLGAEKFVEYQKKFGFGEMTGIDLPAEEVGILHKYEQMGPVELATASFGQTFNITPLQLISAFSATINGGKLYKPYLLSQVVDEDGNIIEENKPFLRRKVISKDVSDIIRIQSESVVTIGTGKSAAIPGYKVGGKTGTAQKLPREANQYIYSFIGYAPVENPQIIALILFDETDVYAEGTGLATRAFKDIVEKTLPYLEIVPAEVDNSLNNEEEFVVIPDLVGKDISQAHTELEALELDYEGIGVGRQIKNQYPNPGVSIPAESQIKLYFTSDEAENCVVLPDFTDLGVEEAKALAKETGFKLEIEGNNSHIESQIPKANLKIERNSTIKLKTKPKI